MFTMLPNSLHSIPFRSQAEDPFSQRDERNGAVPGPTDGCANISLGRDPWNLFLLISSTRRFSE
eukprot:CCRYP_004977-RC/>CCRYP_004977-RC protein AED:0.24 eAED:0.30 QI:1423/0.5/0.66/1/0/0/3/0/63